MLTTKEWRELRQQILLRDGGVCRYCDGKGHQVDWIVPSVHGGSPDPENLVCCCGRCLGFLRFLNLPSIEDKRAYIAERQIHTRPFQQPPPKSAIPAPRKNPEPTSRLLQKLRAKYAQPDS